MSSTPMALFQHWTDAQRDLWDTLSTALPSFQPPEDLNLWRETYMHSLSAWERAVQQSLSAQRAWLAQWSKSVVANQPPSTGVVDWQTQVDEVIDCWLQTQQQLWDQWFDLLRGERYGQSSAFTASASRNHQTTASPAAAATEEASPAVADATVEETSVADATVEETTPPVADAASGEARGGTSALVAADAVATADQAATPDEALVVDDADDEALPVDEAITPAEPGIADAALSPSEPGVAAAAAAAEALATTGLESAGTNGAAAARQGARAALPPDDLQEIRGVGPAIAKRLQEHGIDNFKRLATLSKSDLEKLESVITNFNGRISREDWIGQAKELHFSKYGERL